MSGLGGAIARRFALGGFVVAGCARRRTVVVDIAKDVNGEIAQQGQAAGTAPPGRIEAFSLDSSSEADVARVFAEIKSTLGPIRVLIYNAAQRKFRLENVLEVSVATVENFWRVNCLGALLCAKQALPDMLTAQEAVMPAASSSLAASPSRSPAHLTPPHRGTILFTGATASLRSLGGLSSMSIGKFGLRALAQSLAREFGARGVHVAHVIVDGAVDSPLLRSYVKGQVAKQQGRSEAEKKNRLMAPTLVASAAPANSDAESSSSSISSPADPIPFEDHFLVPAAVAEQYWQLHVQHPSSWTQELDIRPYPEPIFARM